MKVAIIEDELPAARRLESLIRKIIPQVEVVDTADSIEDAVELFEHHEVELAFMDIQLADGQSFRIFEKTEVPCPVIFTTAHDEYAIKAFKVNSIDYLLKPIDEGELERAIQRYTDRKKGDDNTTVSSMMKMMAQMQSPEHFRKRFLLRSGQKLSFVLIQDVRWFISESSTTFLVTHDNQRFIIDQTLDELESELDPSQFFRVSRKYIVAIDSIQGIESYFNNRLLLKLTPEASEEVIVSRQRSREFKEWVDS